MIFVGRRAFFSGAQMRQLDVNIIVVLSKPVKFLCNLGFVFLAPAHIVVLLCAIAAIFQLTGLAAATTFAACVIIHEGGVDAVQ